MSTNTLNTLTDRLFETLTGIKDGSITIENAKAVNDISSTIISGAKVQLDAMKLMKKSAKLPAIIGITGSVEIIKGDKKDLYEQKVAFANQLGYDSYSAAISTLNKDVFEKRFKNEYKLSN
ncbi:hypothetical protein [Flavicella sp.]|uniref:hypothetical protein n=1 Tax=Flavicella sp. TaxID=2957742 RepID=UPI00301B2669